MKVRWKIVWIMVLAAIPLFGQGAGGEDIRDIRGPIHIPDPWMWALIAAGGLAGAALAYAAVRFWRKRAPAGIKLPHEIALERLEKAGVYIDAGKSEEFSVEVSTAVRSYIEAIFHVHAPRKTTEEFLRDLLADSSSILTKYSHLLEDFLKHCDLAKFARWPLTREKMEAMRESAKRFVVETQPQPKAAVDVKPQKPRTVEAVS